MAQEMTLVLAERDAMGQKRELWFTSEKQLQIFTNNDYTSHRTKNQDIKEFLKKVFLPAGYPKTVTPDYLQYQILNAAQAFCNSLAGLLASRAVLEGIGVGSSSATATQAMLLSVLRDAFGRITTIVGAYYLGTSLVSEAKLYRFLADVLNDIPLILDLLTPVLSTSFFPGASTLGLCTSAALRALCGIVAGGSKTAITLHFATPTTGLGDLGDLNAKDSSKETVLALVGMLLGSLIVPFITSAWATYTFLLLLVALHLAINYYAVRGIALRQLNKQRAAIAWLHYRANKKAPTPQQVAEQESIFDLPGIIRDPSTHRIIGQFHMGSAPLDVLRGPSLSSSFLKIFEGQKYIVCFDPHTSSPNVVHHSDSYPIIHVCFHENFTAEDQLKGWIHAVEICRLIASKKSFKFTDPAAQVELITSTHEYIKSAPVASEFQEELKWAGWNMSESSLMSGSGPKALLSTIALTTEKKSGAR